MKKILLVFCLFVFISSVGLVSANVDTGIAETGIDRAIFSSQFSEEIAENQYKDYEEVLHWLIFTGVIGSIVLLLMALYLPRFLANERFAKHFSSKRFKLISIQVTGLIVVLVLGLVWTVLEKDKQETLFFADEKLRIISMSTGESFEYWIDERKKLLFQLGRDPLLAAITKNLLTLPSETQALESSTFQQQAQAFFSDIKQDFGSVGFYIINKDKVNISSLGGIHLGSSNVILKEHPGLLDQAFNGKPVFVPPFHSDLTEDEVTEDAKEIRRALTMFVIAPIRDLDGSVIAVLAQRFMPAGRLSMILEKSRLGFTGETYLVNSAGEMVTESRFKDQLIDVGLLSNSVLDNLEVRDPGGNMLEGFRPETPASERPFTLPVEDLMDQAQFNDIYARELISNVEGYRDYRGVTVYGAWKSVV